MFKKNPSIHLIRDYQNPSSFLKGEAPLHPRFWMLRLGERSGMTGKIPI
jgi:hypothetical protein